MKIWPFMIAASRYRDYQFVVCPDFVQSRGGGLALKNNIEMDDADPTRVRTVVFDDPKLGSIACAYSVGPIGDEGSAQTDSLGRVLLCASGVLMREIPDDKASPKIVEAVWSYKQKLGGKLEEFLTAKNAWTPAFATAVELPLKTAIAPGSHEPAGSSKRVELFAAGAIVLLFAVSAASALQVWRLSQRVDALEASAAAAKAAVTPVTAKEAPAPPAKKDNSGTMKRDLMAAPLPEAGQAPVAQPGTELQSHANGKREGRANDRPADAENSGR